MLTTYVLTFDTKTKPNIKVVIIIIIIPSMAYCTFGKSTRKNPIGVRVIEAITTP